MPGAGTIYSDSFAGQSRGTSDAISPSLSRIFHTIRHTIFGQMVLWLRNSNTIFEGKSGITLKAFKIVNFIIERFKLRKRRFQIINFITTMYLHGHLDLYLIMY